MQLKIEKGSHGTWVEAASATPILETFTCEQRPAVRSKGTNLSLRQALTNLFFLVNLKRWLVFVCQILSLFFWEMWLLLLNKRTVLDQTLQTYTISVMQRCYVKDGVWFQRNIMWDEGTEATCWAEQKEKVEVWQQKDRKKLLNKIEMVKRRDWYFIFVIYAC